MRSTQVAQILNLCAQFVTLRLPFILETNFFQCDSSKALVSRVERLEINITVQKRRYKIDFYYKYCHLFLELSCLLLLVFPVNFVDVVNYI